ncbi:MAG: ECF-type sigma factor [Gemmatimonadales bacterium]
MPEIHELAAAADGGDPAAARDLFAVLYRELHKLAEHHLRRGGSGLTLGTTTLLHEAYLDLSAREGVRFPDRARFLAYASKALRGIVIDYARARRAKKRGSEFEITQLGDEEPPGSPDQAATLEQLGLALEELAGVDPDLVQLVDLHFFAGFSFTEIATMLGRSERTISRQWRTARVLLKRLLTDG